MRKPLLIIGGVVLLGAVAYGLSLVGDSRSESEPMTYSSSEFGLEFSYQAGPAGYVLKEMVLDDSVAIAAGHEKTFIFYRTEDTLAAPPEGGEGPPVIALSVFKNTKNQLSRAWADTHTLYSNINLVMGEVEETVIGGANAIRYRADGLYASDNVVAVSGGKVYMITGQFLDENTDIRRDFDAFLSTIRFIPKPGEAVGPIRAARERQH